MSGKYSVLMRHVRNIAVRTKRRSEICRAKESEYMKKPSRCVFILNFDMFYNSEVKFHRLGGFRVLNIVFSSILREI